MLLKGNKLKGRLEELGENTDNEDWDEPVEFGSTYEEAYPEDCGLDEHGC